MSTLLPILPPEELLVANTPRTNSPPKPSSRRKRRIACGSTSRSRRTSSSPTLRMSRCASISRPPTAAICYAPPARELTSSWSPRRICPGSCFTTLIDQYPNIARVVLHGIGEPMLVKDLAQRVKYLKDRNIYVLFNTNGTLSDRSQRPRID